MAFLYLDCLRDMKFFTLMDLLCGYWNISMHPDSVQKTAFTCHEGLYEFSVMPFGLANAPAKFQRMVDVLLSGLKWVHCLPYLDDILVFSRTFDEHIANLRLVWQRLREARLVLAPKKCFICVPSVQYLGFIVSADGICTDPNKLMAVHKFPLPINGTAVKSFLGLASYARRFICHVSARVGEA
eukprot:GHVQ01038724.1.p1 GENE.GHVQ01038724.1~~GHVQ01038724.1.p1  ORF type:complete len:184 (-),score=8.80 GHVQ01038724.1:204-755(-)